MDHHKGRLKAGGKSRRLFIIAGLAGLLYLAFLIFVPIIRFNDPTATVVESFEGKLLGARIADDGQWRFPVSDSIPEKFSTCLLSFEDQYFYYHPGVNPLAIIRALCSNIKEGRVVSGASTISMQLVRLARKGQRRSYGEKLLEMILALRLECAYSKEEILKLYCSHAPFGGNVVGLEAASWRYYGRPPWQLSWAESAGLAVLPNAPSLVRPGRNDSTLGAKRNRLLKNLCHSKKIDSTGLVLAMEEALPSRPLPLPDIGGTLSDYFYINHRGERVKTSIDIYLQQRLLPLMQRHSLNMEARHIHNLALLIAEVKTGRVLAYFGNYCQPGHDDYSPEVDIIRSPRSTGSILKPLLYAAMLDNGFLLPNMLVADIPSNYSGYSPENYNRSYSGAVPAWQALSHSLNVPAVRMLQEYGVSQFYNMLKTAGISSLSFPPSHYGLALILGGAEASLWELCGIYASMARSADCRDIDNCWHALSINDKEIIQKKESLYSDVALALTFEALEKVHRPQEETGWQYFSSSKRIAWKTGTSFGFKDAWAIGCTPEYVVGVWAGNADGEGRPGLSGTQTAAPLMFEAFGLLDNTGFFIVPKEKMEHIAICSKSGYRAGRYCEDTIMQWIPHPGLNTPLCPYHKKIHLDSSARYRVNAACYPAQNILHENRLLLPPVMEWFYRKAHPEYKGMPPIYPPCRGSLNNETLGFIYPSGPRTIFLPRGLNGKTKSIILEAAHAKNDAKIYWYLDNNYLGCTEVFHQMSCKPSKGKHSISIIDQEGNKKTVSIRIKEK